MDSASLVPIRVKGKPQTLVDNQRAPGYGNRADLDVHEWNAAAFVVIPTEGASVDLVIEGAPSPGGIGAKLLDPMATQTGVTVPTCIEVSCGCEYVRVRVTAITTGAVDVIGIGFVSGGVGSSGGSDGGGGGAVTVANGADVAEGTTSDAAWSGSGAGTLVAVLKALYARIPGLGQAAMAASLPVVVASNQTAVPGSVADGADVAQGTTTDAAWVSGAGTLVGILKALVGRTPALGQAAMAASQPVVVASNQTAVPSSVADGANVALGAVADAAWVSGSGTVVAILKAIWTRLRGGQATAANSLPVVIASDQSGVSVIPGDGTHATPSMDAAARAGFQKITDGTNTLPTMDAAARAGYQRVTDGTNTMPTMDSAARAGFVRPGDGTNLTPAMDASARAGFQRQATNAAAAANRAEATHASATVTYSAGGAGVKHVMEGVVFSLSAAPTTACTVTVTDGASVVHKFDVTQAGPGVVYFGPEAMSANTALTVAISDAGVGITGRVEVLGKRTET